MEQLEIGNHIEFQRDYYADEYSFRNNGYERYVYIQSSTVGIIENIEYVNSVMGLKITVDLSQYEVENRLIQKEKYNDKIKNELSRVFYYNYYTTDFIKILD